MNDDILFSEKQKFRQWWLWMILFGVNGILFFGTIKQVFGGQQFGDNPMSDIGLLVVTGLFLILTLLFFNIRLETIIKKDGIYIRFFPFHLKFKQYSWNEINSSFVRQYSPLAEFGGWGLRFGLKEKGTAYSVSGNKGLQLLFTNNKKLLIGTNRPEELTETLIKIGAIKQ